MFRSIRALEQETGRCLAILQDLGGPKIRLGAIPGDAVECKLDEEFTLVLDRTSDDPRELTCTYRDLARDLRTGDAVLFADGAVAMEVVADSTDSERPAGTATARLKVTLPGRLKSRQGINLPGTALNINALTDKDLRDLDWAAEHKVGYVGFSFVRRAEDVIQLRRELALRGSKAQIVAKIEKPEAVDAIDSIVAQADVVMVARGDLGVEMDVAAVPAIQKRVIATCNRARVPVITATQMLDSMERSSRPTRAEATDVFNAVLDGTDAVMLSGETAAGAYPVEAVSHDEPDRPGGRGVPGAEPAARLPPEPGRLRRRLEQRGLDHADHRGRRRRRQPRLPPPERRAPGRRHPLGPDGAGRLEVPQRHADPGAGRGHRDGAGHGALLGRQPPRRPGRRRRRPRPGRRPRLGEAPTRSSAPATGSSSSAAASPAAPTTTP